jgi:2-polyprenyl-3-methyl-5-hydroxy-6-metoxy-1,4-benzoquinol methylase
VDLGEQRGMAARHPWEVTRAEFFRDLAARSCDLGRPLRVLDLGAGDGWFADEIAPSLAPGSSIVCWDVNYDATQLAAPTSALVQRTAVRPPGTFDLVFLLDVLEHVVDDDALLRDDVLPLLADGATLIVSVPAHPRLFSAHDTFLRHLRRYRPRAFDELLGRYLTVVHAGSLFASLFVGRAAQVAVERSGRRHEQTGVGAWSGGPVVTRALTGILRTDARVGKALGDHGVRLPGLSAWAVCRPRRP